MSRGHVVIVEVYPAARGGAQRTNRLLAGHLPDAGWTTEVVVPHDGPAVDDLRADGTLVTVLGAAPALGRYGHDRAPLPAVALALLRWWVALARYLRRVRPSVVLAGDHRGLLLVAPAARLARVPLVWHLHSAERSAVLNWAARYFPAAVVVPSAAAAARLGLDRAHVVAGAVHPAPAAVAPPDTARPPRVVTVARHHPDKGLDVLLDAVALARRAVPDLVLEVVGSPQPGHAGHAKALAGRAACADLAGAVRWLDDVAAARTSWDDATVYASSSHQETYGLALAEAMAVGLAVVATATDGSETLVDDDVTGALVPVGDPQALAAAIVGLLGDDRRRARLGAAGRAATLARCSLGSVVAAEAAVLAGAAR